MIEIRNSDNFVQHKRCYLCVSSIIKNIKPVCLNLRQVVTRYLKQDFI